MTPPPGKCDTLVSLRDYFEARVTSSQLAIDTARDLMEARMERHELELERRLDALNHLRQDMLTKSEFTASHAALTSEFHAEAATLRAEISALKEWKAEQRGKASMTSVYLSYGVAGLGLVISLVTLIYEVMHT